MLKSGNEVGAQKFIEMRDFLQQNYLDLGAASEGFRWPELNEFNWAIDYFDVMAMGNDKPAVWIVEEDGREIKVSFQEMSRRSSRVANYLDSVGVKRGDRILIALGNQIELWDTMLAAFKLGAVVIPSTVLLSSDDIDDRIVRGRVRHIVANKEHVQRFGASSQNCTRICVGGSHDGWLSLTGADDVNDKFHPKGVTNACDPLLLYFTSGTTSKPKLVLHTHESYPVGHLSTMYWLGLKQDDIHLNISSPGWAKHAWSCFFAPWNAGACIFIHSVNRFSAIGLLDVLAKYKVTTLCAPPTVWRMLIQEDLGAYAGQLKLREVIGAGEPLNTHIIEEVYKAWGLTLRDGYGQTETSAQIGNTTGQAIKAGSMGRPLPGYQIALLDADGNESNEGEICIKLASRPTGLMLGYEGTGHSPSDPNYYHTGDVATRDEQGYITFVGRVDDVFKASDYRISPFELESAMLEHAAVIEVAVVPSPDPLRLHVPKAFIRTVPGITADAALARSLFEFSRSKLAPFKRIRVLEFVEDLPKTISGKIRRVQLRAVEASRTGHNSASSSEFFEKDFAE